MCTAFRDRRVDHWLAGVTSEREQFADLAVFYAEPRELPGKYDGDLFSTLVSRPWLFATSLFDGMLGTAGVTIVDERAAQQLVQAEAAQLPRDHPAVIVLDL